MRVPDHDTGVSVIVGTLILILVTVTAAAGLAVMVAQLQKGETDRQSHLAAVRSEQVQITSPALLDDPAAWNAPPFNISTDQTWKNWSSVSFTMVNLNTDDVRIVGIEINGRYTRNITVIGDIGGGSRTPCNLSDTYLTVPGTKSLRVRVNFTNDFSEARFVPVSDPLKIRVMTSLNNPFERLFSPPNPVVDIQTSSEDLGVIRKDVLFLDGNRSTAGSTIVLWNWTVLDLGTGTISYKSGKTVRLDPRSAGPFSVNLTVTDTANMTAVSDDIGIPADSMFVPPAVLNAQFDSSSSVIQAALLDINGNPVPDQIITFLIINNPYGNLTLDRYYNTTDASGTAGARCTAGVGTVRISYRELPVVDLPVSGPRVVIQSLALTKR